ncbi:MAG: DivIVA domain-containing protein [Clostridia bacterium]|nr:DivIVA domain-containing protein [Clostridia bacterium]
MIKAESIVNKEFKKSLFGYDREDVDRYLDELIVQLRQMETERKEMAATIEYLVSELSQQGVDAARQGKVVEPISPHVTVTDEERRRAKEAEKSFK